MKLLVILFALLVATKAKGEFYSYFKRYDGGFLHFNHLSRLLSKFASLKTCINDFSHILI